MRRVTAAMVAGGRPLAEPRLSPDGRAVAYVAGTGIVVADAAGGPERAITTEPAPAGRGSFDWTPDGAALVYTARGAGLWRQPVAGGPPVQLVDDPEAWAPAVGPDGRVAYQVEHRAVCVDGRRLSGDADFVNDPSWSATGDLAWQEWDVPDMPWDASRVVTTSGLVVERAQQPRFSPDGRRLAVVCDDGGWANVTVIDVATGDRTVLDEPFEHAGPTWGAGQRSFAWSPQGDELVVCRNERGFGSLLRWRVGGERRAIAKAVHSSVSWAGGRIAALRSGARTPTQVVVYEGDARRTLAVGPVAFGDAHLPEPELVSWESDGAEIPGRLYRPTGADRPPLLCWVHGGPTDQWPVAWRARFPYWLDRGWAILVPDHRGSTGHGRAFTQALRGRWGEADVADVAAGLAAGRERGWCDGERMVVMGGSAGGFTALNVLADHPGLCRAGVTLYPVADLVALAQVDYRYEAHYTDSLVGPLPQREAAYRERSPLTKAAGIDAPVLLLHGTDDVVVPVSQAEALAARLPDVELHLYDGEGHGWGRPATVMDELARTERFLDGR